MFLVIATPQSVLLGSRISFIFGIYAWTQRLVTLGVMCPRWLIHLTLDHIEREKIMSGTLKVIVMGAHLGGDCQNRYTATGKQVISFSAASNSKYNGSDGKPVEQTTWLRCTVWAVSDAQAEFFVKNLLRGRKVAFEGRLAIDPDSGGPRLWTDNSGATRASYEVTVNPMTLDISNNGISNGLTTGEGLPAGEEVPF